MANIVTLHETLINPAIASIFHIALDELERQAYDLSRMPAQTEFRLMAYTTCIRQFIALRGLTKADGEAMIRYLDSLWQNQGISEWLQGGRHSLPGVINQHRFASLLGHVMDCHPLFHRIRKKDMARHLACHGLDVVPFNPFFLTADMLRERMSRKKYLDEVKALFF